jgi:hypothetical protein
LPELPETLRSCPALRSVASRIGDAEQVGEDVLLTLWAQDRTAAVQCARRHAALVSIYEDLRLKLIEPEKN